MKDNNWYVEHKTKDADGHEGLSYHGPYVTRELAVSKRDDIWSDTDTYSVTIRQGKESMRGGVTLYGKACQDFEDYRVAQEGRLRDMLGMN